MARPVRFAVPVVAAQGTALPLIICLHGLGGGIADITQLLSGGLAGLRSSYVVAAPQGASGGSWNVVDEPSLAPDVHLISSLIDFAEGFSNVDTTRVVIYGYSNGAALAHRLMIESGDRRIIAAVMESAQLNERQFRNGGFYTAGSDRAYSRVVPLATQTLARRRVMMISGSADSTIPAAGGESELVVDHLTGERLSFVSVTGSVLAYATAKDAAANISTRGDGAHGASLTYHSTVGGDVQVSCVIGPGLHRVRCASCQGCIGSGVNSVVDEASHLTPPDAT